jgi:hypothetical protein
MESETRAGPPTSTPFTPVHLVYDLSRRQRLASHLGAWTRSWPGLIILVVAPIAGVVLLACATSMWFLLLLLIGLPPISFVHRFVGGLVNCLLYRRVPMDLIIEEDRLGYDVGADRRWLDLKDVAEVERFGGDTWCILYPDGTGIDIPVALVDDKLLDHLQRKRTPRPA